MLIRAATPTDASDVATVHHQGWTESYRGLVPDAHLDALSYSDCLARWVSALRDGSAATTLVAEVEGRVVGFVSLGNSADSGAMAAGEVWDLWVSASHRSYGVGHELLSAALVSLAASHRAALVWVLEANARGRAFYSREGAVRDGTSRHTPVAGGTMTDVRYLWDLRGRRTAEEGTG